MRHRDPKSRQRAPSAAEILAAIPHIVYDYANLVSSGTSLTKPLDPPINTHVQDAFLLNCRKMADFLLNTGGPDNIRARHFPLKAQKAQKAGQLPTWQKFWEKAMNHQLAHLLYQRLKPQRWDGSDNARMLSEFQREWKSFLGRLEEPHRTKFHEEIRMARAKRGFGNLDLGQAPPQPTDTGKSG